MKKTLTILLIAVIMLLPMRVSAEEERRAVLVQVPGDWTEPCVWAWDEDGNNAFESWPGGEMETNASMENWYYVWLPAWANHVIVNANEGSVQTEELILEEGNAWISVTAPEEAEISYEPEADFEIPAYVEKFVIHAKVDETWEAPGLWAWSAPDGTNAFESWPGEPMKEGENGWYTAKAPIWVNSVIINANEGSVQTEDISIDPAEIWITVEADGACDFSYVDPDKAVVPNVTVRVIAPADWEAPCLWAWSAPDGTNVFTTWPGEPFEAGEDGWLAKEIPGWVNSVIVNGNEGSVQTTDISVEPEKDIWLVVNGPEDFTVSYEEPEVKTSGGNSTVIIVVVVIVLVAVAAAGIVIVGKKKKS